MVWINTVHEKGKDEVLTNVFMCFAAIDSGSRWAWCRSQTERVANLMKVTSNGCTFSNSSVMFRDDGSVSDDFLWSSLWRRSLIISAASWTIVLLWLVNDVGVTGRVQLEKEVLPRAHDRLAIKLPPFRKSTVPNFLCSHLYDMYAWRYCIWLTDGGATVRRT